MYPRFLALFQRQGFIVCSIKKENFQEMCPFFGQCYDFPCEYAAVPLCLLIKTQYNDTQSNLSQNENSKTLYKQVIECGYTTMHIISYTDMTISEITCIMTIFSPEYYQEILK